MAHIPVPEGLPGIFGLITAYPEPAKHLTGLAQALLRGPSSLTPAEREIIAALVSAQNQCSFCLNSHAAAARCLLGSERQVADQVLGDYQTAQVSEKLKALLAIAEKVRQDGRLVTAKDVARARAARLLRSLRPLGCQDVGRPRRLGDIGADRKPKESQGNVLCQTGHPLPSRNQRLRNTAM